MGLNHPRDLEAWKDWQRRRSLIQQLRFRRAGGSEFVPVLAVRGSKPLLLVALDAAKPTSIASLVRPLEFMDTSSVAVLAPSDVRSQLPGGPWADVPVNDDVLYEQLAEVGAVLATGHFLPIGSLAHRWSRQLRATFFVAQHGLMTPHAPPLPENGRLLAFSKADADFWRSGRTDVSAEVVGSQLLWQAQNQPVGGVDPDSEPVYLGQLHGAELPRRGLARAAIQFCKSTGAVYRPHPSETDKLSRFQHALWERRGVRIDHSGVPLTHLTAPVASAFSTGVLEAAARGIPAWVSYPSPPAWLEEFWERYGLSRWGSAPTPPPPQPKKEPAQAIARIIDNFLGVPS
ncbi:RNA-binding protein [Arthrobacter sp. ISL-28]|uniref:RNA-binding protein n=1 Tax=Arthrobacter sp. ISL-28 TaxID=2819108 RepID=UPI001BE82180|nr:RNA-binding protein [Arthrobacter sp. ISL-28]MBT2519658.1 RNA-binding protein [Arthrobacter sp. ISL-28]